MQIEFNFLDQQCKFNTIFNGNITHFILFAQEKPLIKNFGIGKSNDNGHYHCWCNSKFKMLEFVRIYVITLKNRLHKWFNQKRHPVCIFFQFDLNRLDIVCLKLCLYKINSFNARINNVYKQNISIYRLI